MSYQWLQLRIQEETERRHKEAQIQERLPHALEEIYNELALCVATYTAAFGTESAEIEFLGNKIRITARDREEDHWLDRNSVEVATVPSIPGFRIEEPNREPQPIVIGVLPGEKLFYRDQEEYIGMEELSRRILERVLFPKLTQ